MAAQHEEVARPTGPAPVPQRAVTDSAEPTAPVPLPVLDGAGPPWKALAVGHAEDRAEADADRIADGALVRLRRFEAGGGLAESALAAHQHEPSCDHLRRSPAPSGNPVVGHEGGALDASTSSAIQSRRGSGKPLDADLRRRMEGAFGASFARVRVHADDAAAKLSSAVSARAFTAGDDVFFGKGEYSPSTTAGAHVLAHELAHTLQPHGPVQRLADSAGAPVIRRQLRIGPDLLQPDHATDDIAQRCKDPATAQQLLDWFHAADTIVPYDSDEHLVRAIDQFCLALDSSGARYRIGKSDAAWSPGEDWPEAKLLRRNDAYLFVQNPQERGDMHDIRVAMEINPKAHVWVQVTDPLRVAEGLAIVSYYRERSGRARITLGPDAKSWADYGNVPKSAPTVATDIMLKHAIKQNDDGVDADQDKNVDVIAKRATTGGAETAYAGEYGETLEKEFNLSAEPAAIALINWRASGYGDMGARGRSHPELDTGTEGFAALWRAARQAGYQPVPVGDVPDRALERCLNGGDRPFSALTDPRSVELLQAPSARQEQGEGRWDGPGGEAVGIRPVRLHSES